MSHYFKDLKWSIEPNTTDLINQCNWLEKQLPQKTLDELVRLYLPIQALGLQEEMGRARLLNYHQALEETFIKNYNNSVNEGSDKK
jgi:hypothetical protein